jgi:hypothetical protein
MERPCLLVILKSASVQQAALCFDVKARGNLFEFFRELLGNPEATDSLGGLKQSGKIDD